MSQIDQRGDPKEITTEPGEDVFVFPASFAQQRLWFLDQFEPGSPFYNIPSAVRLIGSLDAIAFKSAINEIVRRHEALRTTFSTMDGNPVQVIHPEMPIQVPIIDLRHIPSAEKQDVSMRLATEEARKPFDITQGPLIRVSILQLDEQAFIVLVTMHHIVSDGWSIGVLIYELSVLYSAFTLGKPSPLPELVIQYADYSEWQRDWLQGEVLDSQINYWLKQLGGDIPVLELPTDRPRPPVLTSRGDFFSTTLSRDLTDGIKALGQNVGATLFMTLMAAYQVLLYRYTNQVDVTVGSPIANRNRGELEALIGVFINTIVLRANLSGNPTFRQLLEQVKDVTLGAYSNQDVPFEFIVDKLGVSRDMSHSPLFQVMFILQNAPVRAQRLPGIMLEPLDVHSGTSTFDMTLVVGESEEGLSLSIEYNTDLFNLSTIQRLVRHYQTILEAVVENPEQRIAFLRLMPQDELDQLLIEWNRTNNDFISPFWAEVDRRKMCIHHLFELQAQRKPDAMAVVVPSIINPLSDKPEVIREDSITYKELDERANQLANALHDLGVQKDHVVGVFLDRSINLIIAILGILKSGAAYLPLDPLAPQERLAFILEDATLLSVNMEPMILTLSHLVDRLPKNILVKEAGQDKIVHPKVIALDSEQDRIREYPKSPVDFNNEQQVNSNNLVYLTYTSGSTGQSKGVMIEHHSLVNAYLSWEESYNLTQVSAHMQMANFTFDVFSGDLVRALCSGGKLVICPREWLLTPERLYALIVAEQIDIAEFVPAVLRNLVQYLEKSGDKLSTFRLLACGSDSWYVGEYRKFKKLLGEEARLINSFGLTETTIDSTYFEGSIDHLMDEQVVPIGSPFSNTRLYILDEFLQPRPINIPGELFIGGEGLARGYHNRPDLNKEKFISSDIDPRGRLYRTGDLARYLPDGNIEFLGRLDDQLKIRGLRIEPGEIEAVLGTHPGVKEVAVVAMTVSELDQRLVAFLVAVHPTDPPTSGELRRLVQDRLPDYMVPSVFVFLDSLPLNSSGKIDRRALMELKGIDWSERLVTNEFVAPRTPVEEILVDIWSQILGVQKIGVYDNFFELGGHSLLATQLISRIRETFHVDLPLRSLFESPTIYTLAENIEVAKLFASTSPETGVAIPALEPIQRDLQTNLPIDPVPLSFAQQRLWFLDQLEPDSPFYNLPEAVRLYGRLNAQVLEKCLNEVIRRHETLRTTFTIRDGIPVQEIRQHLQLNLQIDDLRNLPPQEREPAALKIAGDEAQKPFDLSHGPLLRARLLCLDDEDHIILLTMHHIAGDIWSTNVLIQEMAVLYDAFINERPSPLPDLRIQYADFSTWQRNWLQGEVLQTQIDYWKKTLEGLPPILELPTDRPRPAVQSFEGDYKSFYLSAEVSQKIRELAKKSGTTIFMTLLAAFNVLLSRYSGQKDIAVGTPIANRTRAEIEGLIGFFVNTLVLRTDLSGEPSFLEILKRTREMALGAYAHQDIPFEMIVDALQPERDLGHSPLFQVMFALQNAPRTAVTLPGSGIRMGAVEAHSGTSKFDLTLFMVDEGGQNAPEGQMGGALEYNTDLFDAATIDRLIEHFEVLLSGMVEDPDLPITRLPILTEDEKTRILFEWNRTAAEFPSQLCAHQLFEIQAQKSPEACAITVYGAEGGLAEKSWTFAEINERANQLAHHLQGLGVGPETLVGLCSERSLELVVGLLGILKAGAAYLPLDPTYPVDRLLYMIQDASIPVLLTQAHLLDHFMIKSEESESISTLNADEYIRSTRIICLDTEWPSVDQEPKDNPTSSVAPENLAYVIYTSGSTGRPKGAMIHHRGLVNYLTWCQSAYPLDEGDGSPVHSSISFDLTVTSLLAPLVSGRTAHLLPEGLGVELLTEMLKIRADQGKASFSLIKITPAHLQLLGEQLSSNQAVGRTKAFIIGGENLTRDHIQFWVDNSEETALVNEYGPTETVVGCCVYWARKDEIDKYRAGIVPIGRPIINTQLYILDENLQPVPIGCRGELFIGGAGVGRGYLNRPELTAERFIPNPFEKLFSNLDPDQTIFPYRDRLYRTGDLARYLPDGNIECLGRIDFQVKIRGFRVELGEIEALLNQHPDVDEAVVWVWEDAGYKNLVAYVIANKYIQPNAAESNFATLDSRILREYLGKRLPDYMIPSAFIFLDELPLTVNGKVDRKALPKPDFKMRESLSGFVSPRTPQEELIAGIWSEILGMEKVGVMDNFFDLGGHSLLATQVISRINETFGVELPLRALFESPTVSGLSQQVSQVMQNMEGFHVPQITRLERDPESGLPIGQVPLSFAQQRLWVLDQLMPQNPLYNIPAIVQVDGQLNIQALEFSLNQVVARHEALRTVFTRRDGLPVQVILMEQYLTISSLDLRGVPERQDRAKKITMQEAVKPFDLERGPLIRLSIIQIEDDQYFLLLNTHHIISDDWSLSVLIRELLTFYQIYLSFETRASSSYSLQVEDILSVSKTFLPALDIQYPDYAAWQRQWLRGDVLQKQLDYWKEHLTGLPPLLELPVDRPRPAVQTYNGSQVTFELTPDQLGKLRALGRQHGATLFMTLLAAFQLLLYRYTGQEDIVIGTPIANRTRSELEALIGFFVNTLVMRSNFAGEPNFHELLKRVREAALGAYANQDLPFETLVDALNPQRDMSYHPLFQVMFVHQNAPRQMPKNISGESLVSHAHQVASQFPSFKSLDMHEGIARFDLTLTVVEVPGDDGTRLSGSLEYNTDLFDRMTIDRMAGHLQNLIDQIIQKPDQSVALLEYIPAEEKQLILGQWTGGYHEDVEFPAGRCVHELFEEWALEQPDALALVYVSSISSLDPAVSNYDRQELTYSELNQKANILAHRLISGYHVEPDKLVGICVDRSIEMVVGLMGILKSGGAYLPLDPAYPDDRLAYMIADSGVKVLLTQERLVERLKNICNQQDLNILCIDQEKIENLNQPLEQGNILSGVKPGNLAYVIYTSGSTGRPKGVLIEHKGLTNLVYQQIKGFGINAHSKVLQFASFSFDASVSEIFMGLLSGGQLVLTPQSILSSIPDLLEVMQREDVTTVTLPPSLLRVLDPNLVNMALPKFRTLISAGEPCSKELALRWGSAIFKQPDRQMINAYGPTEATIGPTFYPLQFSSDGNLVGVPEGCKTIPIGKPIPNMYVYILDQNQQLVPAGVTGEIYLGGIGLARGYLNQPELTSEKFIPNPFVPGERLYRTGDLARYLSDGNLEYLGRADFQVKVRGYRIELGEIEANLNQFPRVKTSVAIVREDRPGDKRLVAYLILESPVESQAAFFGSLKEYLHERLPEYMVPAIFMVIDQLPLTPNGKVNRKALPTPEQGDLVLTTEYRAPESDFEVLIESIWSEVLNYKPSETRPTIGVNDNFFELGGDSISGIQVMTRLNQAGLRLTPRHLFEFPTIAGLSRAAENLPVEEISPEAGGQTMGGEMESQDVLAEGVSDYERFGWSEDELSDILGAIEATIDDEEDDDN